MEVNHHPDERIEADERWTEIFDKVFADLRANHPADEWALRLVDQLPSAKATANVTEAAQPPAEEADQDLLIPAVVQVPVQVERQEICQLVAAEDSSRETADDPSKEEADPAPVTQCTNLDDPPESEAAAVVENQVEAEEIQNVSQELAEVAAQIEQQVVNADVVDEAEQPAEGHILLLVKKIEEPPIIELRIEPREAEPDDAPNTVESSPPGDGQEQPQTDAETKAVPTSPEDPVAEIQEQAQSSESAPTEAQTCGEKSDTEAVIPPTESDQDQGEQPPEEVTQEKGQSDEGQVEVDEPVQASESCHDSVEATPTESEPQEQPQPPAEDASQGQTDIDVVVIESQIISEAIQSVEEKPSLPAELDEASTSAESPVASDAAGQAGDNELTGEATLEVVPLDDPNNSAGLEALANQGSTGDPYEEPPNDVEEVVVVPAQVETPQPSTSERLGSSTPNLDAASKNEGQKAQQTGAVKKPPSSPPASESNSRKPEWMRRPLVRKGSVGRILGRMKETMQSKRFRPDRLPVVPPPQPEPPKRPPRRKTLANLDLNRESVTTAQNNSQLESSPPPPKPASIAASDQLDNHSKSATLRSTTSEKKRRNSIGRMASSAASRIGRALSTKQVSNAEGTAAEQAPLLQQEAPSEQQQEKPQQQPDQPQEQRAPSPDKSVKKDPVGQLIRRIDRMVHNLRPKASVVDEAKSKPAPQRPPPPAIKETKGAQPIVKKGKVHFECHNCHHQWKSSRGTVGIELLMNEVGEGIRQGEVLVRLYGQSCNRCRTNVFEKGDWREEDIEKALTEVRHEVSKRFYPNDPSEPDFDERGPKAHQRKHCQACQEGICQRKSAR